MNLSGQLKTLAGSELHFLQQWTPFLISVATTIALPSVNLVFAGQLGSSEALAGVGLGNSFFNVLLVAVMVGYCSVFDTWGSQVGHSSDDNITTLQ